MTYYFTETISKKNFRKINLLKVQNRRSKEFTKFKGKHTPWNHFLIPLQVFRPAHLFKGNSNTGVFLCKFQKQRFYITPPGDCFSNLSADWFQCRFIILHISCKIMNVKIWRKVSSLVLQFLGFFRKQKWDLIFPSFYNRNMAKFWLIYYRIFEEFFPQFDLFFYQFSSWETNNK